MMMTKMPPTTMPAIPPPLGDLPAGTGLEVGFELVAGATAGVLVDTPDEQPPPPGEAPATLLDMTGATFVAGLAPPVGAAWRR